MATANRVYGKHHNHIHTTDAEGRPICTFCHGVLKGHAKCKRCKRLLHHEPPTIHCGCGKEHDDLVVAKGNLCHSCEKGE